MELVLISTLLVAAMATVDIPETHEAEDASSTDAEEEGVKPYGVHG